MHDDHPTENDAPAEPTYQTWGNPRFLASLGFPPEAVASSDQPLEGPDAQVLRHSDLPPEVARIFENMGREPGSVAEAAGKARRC